MGELWTQKHEPKELVGFLGNSELKETALKWGEAWEEKKPQKPLLFVGQPGVGKTLLAFLIARHFDWQVFELSGSDFRDKETIERLVVSAANNATLTGGKRLVLLDEVDSLAQADRGGAGAIVKVLRESKNPVILTANDVYSDRKLMPIRSECMVLDFKKINYFSIAKYLKSVLLKEKIVFEDEAVLEVAKKCESDLRAAILDLQTISLAGHVFQKDVSFLGERERAKKVFSVLSKIFHGKSFEEINKAVFYSDVNNDMLLNWVEENIPFQYQGKDVSVAFDFASRADRFNGRIMNRQYYGFLRYSTDLLSLGVNSAKSREYNGFVPMRFPSLLLKLSRSMSERELKKGLSQKIGEKTHSSFRKVMSQDLPFYKEIVKDKESARVFFSEFELSPHEAGFLLDAKPDSKKVRAFFEEKPAKEVKEKKASKKVLKEKIAEEEMPKQAKLF